MANTDTSIAVSNLLSKYGQDYMSFSLDKLERFAKDVQRITNQRIRQVQRMSENQLRQYGAVVVGQTPYTVGGTPIYRTIVQDGHRVKVPIMRNQYAYKGALSTYDRIMKTGGPISLAQGRQWSDTRGYFIQLKQTQAERLRYLRHEVARGLDYITTQTSSPTGRRKWKLNVQLSITKLLPAAEAAKFSEDIKQDPELLSLFWRAYKEAQEKYYAQFAEYDSHQVVATVYEILQASRHWSKSKGRYVYGSFDLSTYDKTKASAIKSQQILINDIADATSRLLDDNQNYSAREAYQVSKRMNAEDRKAAAAARKAAKEKAKSKR